MFRTIEKRLQEKGFWHIFIYTLTFSVVFAVLNSLTLQSIFLEKILFSLPGAILVLFPIYPVELLVRWSPETCRRIVRMLGILSIFFVSLTKMNF